MTKPPRVVYQELVNESHGGPQHAVFTPRDQIQVRNFRKEIDRKSRLSHDAMFNTYHLCHQLKMKNRKGDPQDFITHFSVYCNVIVHMSAQPLMDSLESLMRLSSEPVMLHYDTVFNMGDFICQLFFSDIHFLKVIQLYLVHFLSIPDILVMIIQDLWKLYACLILS